MPSQGQAHRTLGRKSAPRRALLRQLVTSLIEHESIATTYARAKETQPLVEKLITHAKRNTPSARQAIYGFVFNPALSVRKLLQSLAPRYADRTGGYSRLLHLEPRGRDAAPMAVLELVGGGKDLRLYMTAKAIARAAAERRDLDAATQLSRHKIVAAGMEQLLNDKVELMRRVFYSGADVPAALAEIDAEAKNRARR